MTENVFQDGPYLGSALLCERVIEEKDGTKSLMRIVNRLITSVQGPTVPERMPPIQAILFLSISMRTGKKAGAHDVKIGLTRPDKSALPEQIQRIKLEEPESRSTDIVVNMSLGLDQEGTYWFEIYFDEFLMTKIPLEVVYLTQSAGRIQSPVRPQ